MKYLEKIGFSKDDIAYMMENTPEKFIELLKEQKKLVTENISYLKDLGVTNSYDAEQNIMGGAKLLSQLLKKYDGDRNKALAAYNAGTGNVARYGAKRYSKYYNKVNANEKAIFDEPLADAVKDLEKNAHEKIKKSDEKYWGKETTFGDVLSVILVVLFGVCAFAFIALGIGSKFKGETMEEGVKVW